MLGKIELKNPKKELRNFGLMMGVMIILIFGLFFPWVFDNPIPRVPFYIAGGFWLPALIFPLILKPVFFAWMAIGGVLGAINTRIILGFIFFVVFCPVAIFFKIIGRDAMNRKLTSQENTYRIVRESQLSKEHMERPF